jgi:hypothetical protein
MQFSAKSLIKGFPRSTVLGGGMAALISSIVGGNTDRVLAHPFKNLILEEKTVFLYES